LLGAFIGLLIFCWVLLPSNIGEVNLCDEVFLVVGCRRKLVDSLPWGIPMVVVYRQTGAQATNLMVTQDMDKDFIQVRPPCGRNTYVLRLIVLDCVELR